MKKLDKEILDNLEMRPKGTFFYNGFVDFCNYLKENNVKKILEIGSYNGESMTLFKEIVGPDTIVICIDPYSIMPDENDILQGSDLSLPEKRFNLASGRFNKIGKMKFYSQDISEMFADGYFDVVYIDGLHTYDQVKLDIKHYLPKIKRGGIISGHDYTIPWTADQQEFFYNPEGIKNLRIEVSKAVDELFDNQEIKIFKDSTWAIKL